MPPTLRTDSLRNEQFGLFVAERHHAVVVQRTDVGVEHTVADTLAHSLDCLAFVVDRTTDRALGFGIFEHDQREDHL